MAIIKKTLFPENLEKYNTFVRDTDPTSKYFKITELSDTLTGGKNAFLIQGSEYLVPDTLIKIEIKDSQGNIVYHEPGEGIVSSSVNGTPIVTEYYEGVSKVVSVYVYPDTTFGPATITILGEVSSYDNNGLLTPIPMDWEGKYNVKWQRQVNINPALPNTTKIRFYKRPTAKITEILSPIYSIVGDSKIASAVTQSFANIKLSNLETFAGDVKRVKVFRTSQGDISDYDMIQDILVESKELMTSYGLSGSVVGNTGIFTAEVLKNQWNSGSLNATLNSTRVEAGVRLTGSGYFTYTQSLDLKSTNTYELNLDAFYSASTDSNLGIYLVSGSASSSIATLYGTQPTKNLLDTTIPFTINKDYPTASLYFSQSQGQWHLGNVSLKLSQDTAFSPDEVSFITTMPTVLGNETFNFKFEFYDVNNNYVPVAVTQSATFNGGNTNIGGTILLISSSASSSLDALNRVSSSISGTVTFVSSSVSGTIGRVSGSVSGSLYSLSGSVSGTIGNVSSSVSGTIGVLSGSVSGTIGVLSGSVSASIAKTLYDSFAKVQQLANGGYPGTFISNDTIYSPVLGGQLGYISELFKVGTAPSIYLDARQTPRKIFIGGAIPSGQTEYSGAFNNTNTNVYLDSAGKFSLGNKLSYDGTNLSVNGSINITNPSTANNGGKVGGFSNGDALTGGSIAGVTIASDKIYIGTGTYGNANTGFYVDSSGNMSLKDKFTWNNNTGALTIQGTLKIADGTGVASTTALSDGLSGKISTGNAASDVNSNSTTISGGKIRTGTIESTGYDYSSGNFSNVGMQINLDNGVIRSKNFGITSGGNAYFKGDISGASGTFSGTLSGATITGGSLIVGTGDGRVIIDGTDFQTRLEDVNNDRTITIGPGGILIKGDHIDSDESPKSYIYLRQQNDTARQVIVSYSLGIEPFVVQGFPTGNNSATINCFNGGLQARNYSTYAYGTTYNGNGNAGYAIQCLGTFYGSSSGTFVGAVTQNTSDKRLKTNIKNIDSPLEKISKINGVYFNWNEKAKELADKDTEIREIGFIAQEVNEILPEIVKPAPFDIEMDESIADKVVYKSKTGEDYLTIQYEKIVPLLVECIKELKAEIEELKKNK